MKKKVLSQINTLAKRIITSENEMNIVQIKNTLIQLYEKLSVLEFLETSVESEFTKPERPAIDSKTYREENWFKEPDPVPQPQHEDSLVAPLMDKIKDIMAQMPTEKEPDVSVVEDFLKEILPKEDTVKNDLEEFAADYQEMPIFERKEEEKNGVPPEVKSISTKNTQETAKPKSLNDKLNQGVAIGLNDRLAFIKQLFEGSSDDYTRVLSQVNSMTTYEEAHKFINTTVKPDYNNWEGKEEFAERFLQIIEKRFN